MTGAGLLGILIGLGLLIAFAFRGWSVLLLAPLAALIAALCSREPLLAHWTQIFMVSAAGFLLFRAAGIPRRLMPAAIVLGTSTFTMSALPGTPSIQNAIPMP
ncbi:H+/gluconate symporter-like permease [Bradyrhizobium sp. AZCC 1693]